MALVVSSAGYPCIAFVVARKQGGEALAARCPGLGLDGEVPLAPAASAAHTTIDAVALALDAHHRPVIAATYTAVGVRAAAVRAYSPASRSWAAVGQPLPAWGADLALAVAPDGAALVALADSRHGGALSLLRCDSLAASGWEELGSGVSVGAALAIRLALRPGGAGGDVLAAWMDDAEGLGAAEYGAASGTWRQLGAAPSVAADWVPLEGAPRGSPEGRCRCAIERPGCGGGGQLTCQTHGPHHDCKQAYHLPPSPPSILLQAAWRWVWGQRVHPLWRWHVTRQTLRAAWSACCSTTAAAGRWQAATQPRTAACCRWRASQACPR